LDDSNTTTSGIATVGSGALVSPPSSSSDVGRGRRDGDSSVGVVDVEFDFGGGVDGEGDKKIDPDYVENGMGRGIAAKRTRIS